MKNGLIIAIRVVVLFFFWVLLSGKLDASHLGIGLLCSLVIALVSFPNPQETEKDFSPRDIPGYFFRGCRYAFWLLTRIILAAIHVTKLILDPKMPIHPEVIRHETILSNDNAKVIFANSITLTPGTITADFKGKDMAIHRLDKESSGDIDSRHMEHQIQRIFKGQKA
ncbi:MAG: Na+/H+ antiporter subunit E [Candidatus Omnitrophica bacterium]|nr:Na+/H+ antiporter subunit E [Candidatus Omnitrophota bacterium]